MTDPTQTPPAFERQVVLLLTELMDRQEALNERVTATLLDQERLLTGIGPRLIVNVEKCLAKIEGLEKRVVALEAEKAVLSAAMERLNVEVKTMPQPGPMSAPGLPEFPTDTQGMPGTPSPHFMVGIDLSDRAVPLL